MASILIFEDDIPLGAAWKDVLEQAGHTCVHAYTLREAERIHKKQFFDVVVVDLYLNRSDGSLSAEGGLLLLTSIRGMLANRATRVLVVTGVDLDEAEFDILSFATELGADKVLRKPVPIPILTEIVERFVLELSAPEKDH